MDEAEIDPNALLQFLPLLKYLHKLDHDQQQLLFQLYTLLSLSESMTGNALNWLLTNSWSEPHLVRNNGSI